jgi:O-antigen/teichoic acid export membrane protein
LEYTPRRIAVNSVAVFGSYLLNTALSVLVAVAIVRHLGPAEYGVMTLVMAYLSFFQAFTHLGVDTVLLRETARRPEEASRLIGAALGLRLVLSVLAMAAAWAFLWTATDDIRVRWLIILQSTTFLFSSSTLYAIVFNARLQSHIPNAVLGVWSVLYTLLRLGLVAAGARVVHFLTADVASNAASFVISRWVALRFSDLRPRIHVDPAVWKTLLAAGVPIAISGWLISLHLRIDQILLYRMRGSEALGGYSAAVKLSEVWGVLATVSMASLFPILARLAAHDPTHLDRLSRLSYRYLYLVICPIALILAAYPSWLLSRLFGPGFAEAATALAFLAIAEVFAFGNALTFNLMFSANLQLGATLVAALSVVTNTALNLWLIPAYGGAGAAAASAVSYGLVPVITLLVPGARRFGSDALVTLVRPAIAAGLVFVILWRVAPPVLGGTALALAGFPLVAWALGDIRASDFALLKRAVLNR